MIMYSGSVLYGAVGIYDPYGKLTNEELAERYKKHFYHSGHADEISHYRFKMEPKKVRLQREAIQRQTKIKRIKMSRRRTFGPTKIAIGSKLQNRRQNHWME
jgi:hypothetical protein